MMKITTALLKKYFYDNCSREEEIEVQKWLAENDNEEMDNVLREIILEMKIEDRDLSQAAFNKFKDQIEVKEKSSVSTRLLKLSSIMQRVAAILLIPILLFGGYLFYRSTEDVEWSDITVPYGTQQTLVLSDGTTLHLNSGTQVIFPSRFTDNERKVFINGEVFADVTKNANKPFVISAGDIKVKVLGTQFNLRAYGNIETVEVALVEGSVSFESKKHKNEILKEGEMIQFNRLTQELERSKFSAANYRCPSKDDGFYFSNLSLGDIVKELEYYFDVKIVILNEKLSKSTYIAYFTNRETLDEILSDLNANGEMSIIRKDNFILIDYKHPLK